jgi:hypothetical protein
MWQTGLPNNTMNSNNREGKGNLYVRTWVCLQIIFLLFVIPCSAQVNPDSSAAPKDSVPVARPVIVSHDSTLHDSTRKPIHKIVSTPKKPDSIFPKPADTILPAT